MITVDPLSPSHQVATKINAGQPVRILCIGDSTTAGVGDETFVGGYPPRLAWAITPGLDVSTRYPIGGGLGWRNPLNGSGWSSSIVYVMNAGIGASRAWQWIDLIANAAPNSGIRGAGGQGVPAGENDLLIVGLGLNDGITGSTPEQYSGHIQQVVEELRVWNPTTPIILTTENNAGSPYGGGSYNTAIQDMFAKMTADLVGQHLPMSPALIKSGVLEEVWVLDTTQAFGPNLFDLSLMYEGLHPNAAGYQEIAQFVYDWVFTGEAGEGPGEGPEEPAEPFVGNSIMKPKIKLAGMWYPVRLNIKVDGEWRRIVPRC